MRVPLLVLILLLGNVPMQVQADSGRAMTAEIVLSDYVWTSADEIIVEIYVSGAPFNQNITLEWELHDENGLIDSESIIFQMSGSTHIVQLTLSQFYQGGTYHDISVDVSIGSTIVSDNYPFTVLRNSLLEQASNLVVFGDSLSDMGNGNNSAFVSVVFSSPPYWNGRFSNGPVWIEHISNSYALTTTFGDGTAQGDNRAFGGSQTGQGYAYLTLPNVGTQINNYLAKVQSNFTNSDVIFLWAGGNDFLYGTGNPDLISQNMASHIQALALAGATRLVVANLPPLELTPEGASRSNQQQSTMASDVILYNTKLAQEINNLSASMNLDITLIDAWSIFHQIVNNADHVGISNTQDQACSGGASVPLVPLPICGSGANVVSNVDEYLFFDRAHPSATMHKIIGQFAVTNIGDADTDGDGIVDTDDLCEWTEDLLTVNLEGCDWNQQDEDSDGVVNSNDECLQTSPGYSVDINGCAEYQKDTDGDGLTDDIDPCPYDLQGDDYDSDGCIDSIDNDDDNDGVTDSEDNCPMGMIGPHSQDYDQDGCHDDEDTDDDNDGLNDQDESATGSDPFDVDSDDDGVWDGQDVFPTDPNEWKDSDGDGYGDNSDDFPYDDSEWEDSDYDDVGDNSDVFPNDPNEWFDSDLDGFGDNSDAFPYDDLEWLDSDLDSCGDNSDALPFDSTECLDSDLDGVGDNSDPWPNDPREWADSDFDGVGDNSDFDPYDASETKDSDGDGVGDNEDIWPNDPSKKRDSDGDGIADSADAFPNNAGMDSWTGIIVSLSTISVLVVAGLIYVKRFKKEGQTEDEWTSERPLEAPDSIDWK